jgi:hypothetical protein
LPVRGARLVGWRKSRRPFEARGRPFGARAKQDCPSRLPSFLRASRASRWYCGVGRWAWSGVWGGVWGALWRRLGNGSGQKSQDIGPFWFVFGKIAKNFGKLRPGAEAAFEGTMVEFSEMIVGATGGDFAVFANCGAPIFE